MNINSHKVIEVIGRLIGRAQAHANAAHQTNCQKKKDAHSLAAKDMFALADELASATDKPEWCKSQEAYRMAVK